MPARNESGRVQEAIQSVASSRETLISCEIVVVDDASIDGCCDRLTVDAPNLELRVVRSVSQVGVARARNLGAAAACGEILFVTDSHVQLRPGWDRLLLDNVSPRRIAAATIADRMSGFRACGCSLIVPFMGTRWNRRALGEDRMVQIASSAGTGIRRDVFWRIGGYDEGMKVYGAAEPEFSVRAWLSGVEIVSVNELEVAHQFKTRPERNKFLRRCRAYMVHNNLRFGLLYLGQSGVLQMLRHYSMIFPRHMRNACRMLEESDVWYRQSMLRRSLKFDFLWFIRRFNLRDQSGNEIWRDAPDDLISTKTSCEFS